MARNAFGLEFGSAVRLSKRSASVWYCLWGHVHDLLGSIVWVGYCISSPTCPSLPKKHYNGLINQSIKLTPCINAIVKKYSGGPVETSSDSMVCSLLKDPIVWLCDTCNLKDHIVVSRDTMNCVMVFDCYALYCWF